MTAETSAWAARFGVFGDLPTRLLRRMLALLPWFLEPVLSAAWTFLFFLIAGSQRRSVAGNLGALHPQWSGPRRLLGAWRVFRNFAATYVDALRFDTGSGGIDWAIDGVEAMDALNRHPGGCVVLTAHMGNYDLAAPVFAARFTRTLHTVRAPERQADTRRLREEEIRRREQDHPGFRTHYNNDRELLGVELARLLAAGDIVALQGDRVLFDVSPMDVEVEPGLWMRLPRGPLFLARASGAPCFPVFITRDGWRRYRVTVLPPLPLPRRWPANDPEVPRIWAKPILETVRRHWDQWFVFEPLLSRRS